MKGSNTTARIAIATGAVGALALMLQAGPDAPWLLKVLMGGWVLSPFAALAYVDKVSGQWTPGRRTTLHTTAVVVTLATLATYWAIASKPTRAQTPFFVMVPPTAWIAITVAYFCFSWNRAPRRMSGSE